MLVVSSVGGSVVVVVVLVDVVVLVVDVVVDVDVTGSWELLSSAESQNLSQSSQQRSSLHTQPTEGLPEPFGRSSLQRGYAFIHEQDHHPEQHSPDTHH